MSTQAEQDKNLPNPADVAKTYAKCPARLQSDHGVHAKAPDGGVSAPSDEMGVAKAFMDDPPDAGQSLQAGRRR